VEYCCFNGKAFLRFDFIQYSQHASSYVLVQVTVNAPLVQVKLLLAVNGNPNSYSYSYSCLCERSLRRAKAVANNGRVKYKCPTILWTVIQFVSSWLDEIGQLSLADIWSFVDESFQKHETG